MKCEAYNVEINNAFELVTLLLIARVCLLRSRNPSDLALFSTFLFILLFVPFSLSLSHTHTHTLPILRSLAKMISSLHPFYSSLSLGLYAFQLLVIRRERIPIRLQDVGIASYERLLTLSFFFSFSSFLSLLLLVSPVKVDPSTFYRSALEFYYLAR